VTTVSNKLISYAEIHKIHLPPPHSADFFADDNIIIRYHQESDRFQKRINDAFVILIKWFIAKKLALKFYTYNLMKFGTSNKTRTT
jgi:hypothetical protein